MIQIFELSEKEFKITIINMLRALVKSNRRQEQFGNIKREMENIGKKRKKMPEIKKKTNRNEECF